MTLSLACSLDAHGQACFLREGEPHGVPAVREFSYGHVQLGDVDGDGRRDVLTRGGDLLSPSLLWFRNAGFPTWFDSPRTLPATDCVGDTFLPIDCRLISSNPSEWPRAHIDFYSASPVLCTPMLEAFE